MGFLKVIKALGRPAARFGSRLFRGGADDAARAATRAVSRSTPDVATGFRVNRRGQAMRVGEPFGALPSGRRAIGELPAAGQTTVGRGRGSQLAADAPGRTVRDVGDANKNAARRRAQSAAQEAAEDAAEKVADDIVELNLRQRLAKSVGPGGGLRRAGKWGVGLAALEGVSQSLFDKSPLGGFYNMLAGEKEEQEDLDVEQALNIVRSQQEPEQTLAQQFNAWMAENPYVAAERPDLMGAFRTDAANQQARLEDYLNATGQYSRNQAQAIADAYQGMSQNLLESSGNIFERGQVTAADIDRLYETLAAENLGTAYGEGLSTPVSDTAGLAAPSGEMATGGDTARAYGGSLADYLGQEAGIESAALEQIAGSQALQGAALAQSLRDYVTMAEAEKRYQLGRELSAQERAVADQEAMLEWQADQNAIDYQLQLAQQLFGFQATDNELAQAREIDARNSAAIAANLWNTATPENRKIYERMVGGVKGQAGLNLFVQLVYNNPELITAMGA